MNFQYLRIVEKNTKYINILFNSNNHSNTPSNIHSRGCLGNSLVKNGLAGLVRPEFNLEKFGFNRCYSFSQNHLILK